MYPISPVVSVERAGSRNLSHVHLVCFLPGGGREPGSQAEQRRARRIHCTQHQTGISWVHITCIFHYIYKLCLVPVSAMKCWHVGNSCLNEHWWNADRKKKLKTFSTFLCIFSSSWAEWLVTREAPKNWLGCRCRSGWKLPRRATGNYLFLLISHRKKPISCLDDNWY